MSASPPTRARAAGEPDTRRAVRAARACNRIIAQQICCTADSPHGDDISGPSVAAQSRDLEHHGVLMSGTRCIGRTSAARLLESDQAGLETRIVSAQLDALLGDGLVEKACVPTAERSAIHKLIVASLRVHQGAKREKDLRHAAVPAAVLGVSFPGALEPPERPPRKLGVIEAIEPR